MDFNLAELHEIGVERFLHVVLGDVALVQIGL